MKTETEYSGANVLGARNGQCQSSEWDGRQLPDTTKTCTQRPRIFTVWGEAV